MGGVVYLFIFLKQCVSGSVRSNQEKPTCCPVLWLRQKEKLKVIYLFLDTLTLSFFIFVVCKKKKYRKDKRKAPTLSYYFF